jgi:hypothetical protein
VKASSAATAAAAPHQQQYCATFRYSVWTSPVTSYPTDAKGRKAHCGRRSYCYVCIRVLSCSGFVCDSRAGGGGKRVLSCSGFVCDSRAGGGGSWQVSWQSLPAM